MKSILFALLLLTKPDGGPIWFAKEQIVAITSGIGGATTTAVITLNGTFYVKETPEIAVKKYEKTH